MTRSSLGLTNEVNGDIVGTHTSPVDPLLGALANNGGPTQTLALLSGSLAIDAGDNCVFDNNCSPALASALATDQRGQPRQIDGDGNGTATVDIGAFEVRALTTPRATSVNITGSPFFGQLLTGQYTYTDLDGDVEGISTFRWLRNGVAIGGATAITYTTVSADVGQLLTFEVTPVAATGDSPGTAATSVGVTVTKASSTVTVSCPASATYSGAKIAPCTAAYSGAGGLSGTLTPSYTNNTNVGTATASASYAGDANHDGSSNSANFEITKASSTVTVSFEAGPYVYRSSAFTAAASVTGIGGLSEPASVVYIGDCTNVTSANGCAAAATYAGDANHTGSSDSKSITIGKASQTITFSALLNKTPGDADFTVSAPASSGLSVGFTASGQCTVTGSTVHITGAGSCTITASQGGDSNFDAASDVSQTFTIGAAPATHFALSSSVSGTPGTAFGLPSPNQATVARATRPASPLSRQRSTPWPAAAQ